MSTSFFPAKQLVAGAAWVAAGVVVTKRAAGVRGYEGMFSFFGLAKV